MLKKYRILFFLFTAEFGGSLVWNNFSPILPIVSREWLLTGTMAGSILAVFQVGYVASVLPTGNLSDRFGGRRVLAICALWTGLVSLAFSFFAHDYISALTLRALAGIGVGGLYVPGLKILTNWFPTKERGKAIAIFTFSNFAAAAGGYYIGGPLAALYGWRQAIFWTSIWAIPAAPLAYFAVEDRPSVAVAEMNVQERQETHRYDYGVTQDILRKKPLWLITGAYMGHMWELFGMQVWIGPFFVASLTLSGAGAKDALVFGSLAGATAIILGGVFNMPAGYISDRIGRCKTAIMMAAVSVICSFSFGWLILAPLWLSISIGLLYGCFAGMDSPIYKAGLSEMVVSRYAGLALALQSLLGFGMTTISPALFGWILDITNPSAFTGGQIQVWGWAFAMLGVGAMASPVIMFILSKHAESVKMAGGLR